MKNKKKEILLVGLGIVSILVVIIGITYAFFNYTKQGSTNNVIETGTIKFLYDEKYGYGNGIQIIDAVPMSDTLGKRQKGENQVFDFKITSDTMSNISIPYEITVRKDSSSTLPNSMVKIYLAKVYGENEEEVALDTFDKLSNPSTNLRLDNTIEKRIYKGKVASGIIGYNQDFRLKMWIAEDADFSPNKDTDGNSEESSPYNGATFKVRVNVYSKGVPLTEEEIENEGKAEITGIEVDNKKAVKVENRDYDYELGLASGTREIDLDVLTDSDDADTKIERVDNNTSMNSEIKRLSANKTLSLTEGDNLFRITAKSVDESVTNTSIINIHVGGYQEAELNGTDPVLRNNLIPIIIKNDGSVYKVDTNYSWYRYENKEWANAIILKDKSISYDIGEEIPEENIESYFVWIPKYSYELWNVGTTNPTKTKHQIPIRFGTENTVSNNGESCVTPISNNQGIAGDSSDCDNGEYMTHPAFITLGVNGFWVGKYETGYNQNSDTSSLISDTSTWTTSGAQVNSSDSSKIIIKPDVYSWRGINVVNMFLTSYNYITVGDNHYSHMMKNTEWGAVAYLSHSKYGIGTEVRNNNNPNYKTGYVASIDSDQSTSSGDTTKYELYNTEQGYKASTTGNITGIYDMSGGAHEFMSSYSSLTNSTFNANSLSSYSGKYFDVYPSNSNVTSYTNRILGDAIGEVGPYSLPDSSYRSSWYLDEAFFIEGAYPWVIRSGGYSEGKSAGQFYFHRANGEPLSIFSFRIVIE